MMAVTYIEPEATKKNREPACSHKYEVNIEAALDLHSKALGYKGKEREWFEGRE